MVLKCPKCKNKMIDLVVNSTESNSVATCLSCSYVFLVDNKVFIGEHWDFG